MPSLLTLQPGASFEAKMSFSGCLERAGNESISIRLPDRRVICARLPNTPLLSVAAIAAQYHIGDQVEITCKPIQPVWEEGTARLQYLEVQAIRFVRRPSPGELSKTLVAIPFREGENLLEHPDSPVSVSMPNTAGNLTAPGASEFESARKTNLEYAANLPNFVADETVRRYRSTRKSPRWSDFDTVVAEVTFQGDHTVRRQILRNGSAWDQTFEALPGFKWYGGYGHEIKPLFDPQCPTTIEYQGRSQVDGRQLLEYRFSAPVDGCASYFYFQYQRYNPARTGHIFIDASTGNVIQLDEDARGFPAAFEFAEREEQITWDYVRIGEASHLLPVRALCIASYYSGTRYRIEVEYNNHRHFETSTNITFH